MERGVTHDLEFETWANKVHNYEGDATMDPATRRASPSRS